ncbi:MAG: MFS transporter [Bdellovibrionales bacterium RIFOXYD1_FULL_53_11]|nr:MAG: MFS transporter [Bdellovibrionales bacterium RIFOXYD1_FULL_53_11]
MKMTRPRYRWAQWGDLNAFFGLMLDNVTNLVILSGLLGGVFGYPVDMIYSLMIPGTALGVLFGDLLYTWLAFRLARKTGRSDVTAMPLGLDTPSTIGVALAVLGPVYLETKDAMLTWQVGMCTLMLIGLIKVVFSFFGDWVRTHVPSAGLLGSLAGIGIALLTFFPLMKIFSAPAAGMASLGIILYSIIARRRLPLGLPGAFTAVAVGCLIYYFSGSLGLTSAKPHLPELVWAFHLPLPTLDFIHGFGRALGFLPIALPFALLTIIGGINTTESARVAGDEYKTRDILLAEALATIVAALFGGVAQSTPYIGHPAYKAMGGRAAYTLATGLFIGIAGMMGIMGFIVEAIPEAVITPILLFVGLEIVSQAFMESPRRHSHAVAFATIPIIGYLVLIFMDGVVGRLSGIALPESITADHATLRAVGHGFILTAMLWGGMLASLIDGKTAAAVLQALVCAAFTLFGIIHSVSPAGDIYLPWRAQNPLVWEIALGYFIVAMIFLLASSGQKNRRSA